MPIAVRIIQLIRLYLHWWWTTTLSQIKEREEGVSQYQLPQKPGRGADEGEEQTVQNRNIQVKMCQEYLSALITLTLPWL